MTSLAEVLRKDADFIRAMEICAETKDGSWKTRITEDRNPTRAKKKVEGQGLGLALHLIPTKHIHIDQATSHA